MTFTDLKSALVLIALGLIVFFAKEIDFVHSGFQVAKGYWGAATELFGILLIFTDVLIIFNRFLQKK